MRIKVALGIFLIASCAVSAQTFTHTAAIPGVYKDGFYRISITPELGGYLAEDFSNIRIIDGHEKEVPYLIDEELPYKSKLEFHPYEMLEKVQKPGCCTTIILKNARVAPINNISLIIKNADVLKVASLLGSDDKKQWYALKQHFSLNYLNNTTETSEVKIIDFPLSNYLYYRINIEDSTTSPLNILKAGFYDLQTETGKYVEIPGIAYKVTDSLQEKSTYIHLTFNNPRFVDKIDLKLKGAPFFRRNATLYLPKAIYRKKGKKQIKEHYNEYLSEVEISSTHATTLSFSKLKAKELLLIIDNKDNPSLMVEDAKCYQLNRVITTWLKKGESYSIKLGRDLQVPSYDLDYFRDSIPEDITVLKAESVSVIPILKNDTAPKTFFTSKLVIWVVLIAVIVVMGLMSVKMIKETGDKN